MSEAAESHEGQNQGQHGHSHQGQGHQGHQGHHEHRHHDGDRPRGDRDHNERRRRPQNKQDGPKREAILDLNQYKDTQIRVKFIGGRQIVGVLKGFDQLMNLVMDDVEETMRDPHDDTVLTGETRKLGFVVVRCTSLLTISPVDGSHEIANPFLGPGDDQ
ncbi:U6 snRNA-associated Sm-like protein LSm7 [Diutina catenulata]